MNLQSSIRRGFLGAVAGIALSSFSLPKTARGEESGRDFSAIFARNLDGSSNVACYPIRDPKIVLIHFRQMHQSGFSDAVAQIRSSTLPLIQNCQADIRLSVADLISRGVHPDGVYIEGVNPKSSLLLEGLVTSYRRKRDEAKSAQDALREIESDTAGDLPKELKPLVERARQIANRIASETLSFEQTLDTAGVSIGTGVQISGKYNVPIRPVETARTEAIFEPLSRIVKDIEDFNLKIATLEATKAKISGGLSPPSDVDAQQISVSAVNQELLVLSQQRTASIKAYKQYYFLDHFNEMFTVREDEYLGRICSDALLQSGSAPYIAAICLGGDHDLRDNVEDYNRLHADTPCMLIVVTPKRYQEGERP